MGSGFDGSEATAESLRPASEKKQITERQPHRRGEAPEEKIRVLLMLPHRSSFLDKTGQDEGAPDRCRSARAAPTFTLIGLILRCELAPRIHADPWYDAVEAILFQQFLGRVPILLGKGFEFLCCRCLHVDLLFYRCVSIWSFRSLRTNLNGNTGSTSWHTVLSKQEACCQPRRLQFTFRAVVSYLSLLNMQPRRTASPSPPPGFPGSAASPC
jgi:hypothetical protein